MFDNLFNILLAVLSASSPGRLCAKRGKRGFRRTKDENHNDRQSIVQQAVSAHAIIRMQGHIWGVMQLPSPGRSGVRLRKHPPLLSRGQASCAVKLGARPVQTIRTSHPEVGRLVLEFMYRSPSSFYERSSSRLLRFGFPTRPPSGALSARQRLRLDCGLRRLDVLQGRHLHAHRRVQRWRPCSEGAKPTISPLCACHHRRNITCTDAGL